MATDFSKYSFVFNALAYFDSVERYGKEEGEDFFTRILQDDLEGLEAVCWGLEETSMQGNARRKFYGYTEGEVLDGKKLFIEIKPNEVLKARTILLEAIRRGMGAADDDEEIDEVLVELQKKTKKG